MLVLATTYRVRIAAGTSCAEADAKAGTRCRDIQLEQGGLPLSGRRDLQFENAGRRSAKQIMRCSYGVRARDTDTDLLHWRRGRSHRGRRVHCGFAERR
jgi:hypothetical protein